MAFIEMWSEIHGTIPKLPAKLCKTLVNRAWADIRRQNLWSFLLFEARWVTPAIINTGTATTTIGSTTVTMDATAAAAINAAATSPTLITQRQFRVGISGIYNIWGWDGVNTLTLDQAWEGPSATSAYRIFQNYYPAPMRDLLSLVTVRDMKNFISLFVDRYTRADLDNMDPQRTWYYFPTDVVFYQQDQNTAGLTPGWPLYELWGAPQYNLVYQLYGIRGGTDLVADTDTLPVAVGEDCVVALAKKYAYEWAEANKGDNPRNVGPDFRFLVGSAMADYYRLFKDYRRRDRETVDNWFSVRRTTFYGKFFSFYNSISQTASPWGYAP